MVSMLVLGGGGAFDGCCPRICWPYGPLLELGLFTNESARSVLAWGHFSVFARRRGGSGGSH